MTIQTNLDMVLETDKHDTHNVYAFRFILYIYIYHIYHVVIYHVLYMFLTLNTSQETAFDPS